MNKNLIYALKDPETNEIRYIGKSTSGLRRPNQHKQKYGLLTNNHKNNWIKSLLAKGLMYEIIILEENIELESLNNREKYWVTYYKSLGSCLTNQTDGGEGTWGYKMDEQAKELMSEKRKLWFKENGPTEKMLEVSYKKKERKIIDEVEHKHCWRCDIYKPLSAFGQYLKAWDRLNYHCKECHNNFMAEYRETHAGPLLTQEQMAKSYTDRKEAMRAGVIQAYKDNPDIKRKISEKTSKPILQCDINTGKVIKEFASALKAKEAGFQNANIGQAIKFKRPYRGFIWKFKILE